MSVAIRRMSCRFMWKPARVLYRGVQKGALDMCIGLLKDGVISMAEAAKRLSMTEEELKAKMS